MQTECVYCNGEVKLVSESVLSKWYQCQQCKKFIKEESSAKAHDQAIDRVEVGPPSCSQERNTQETSIKAKKSFEESGKAEGQRNYVLSTIRESPDISIREIAMITGLEKSSISPRLDELRKAKLVVQSGWKKFPDNEVMIWKAALRL